MFTAEFTEKAARLLGESKDGIAKALTALVAAGFAGVLHTAGSGPEGTARIFGLAREAAGTVPAVPGTAGLVAGASAPATSGALFGGNLASLLATVSRQASISERSVRALLEACLSTILGLLGRYAEQHHLNSSGLRGFLSAQREPAERALPPELHFLSGMPAGVWPDITVPREPGPSIEEEPGGWPRGGSTWLMVLLLALITLLWFMLRGSR